MDLTPGIKKIIKELYDLPKLSSSVLMQIIKQQNISANELEAYSRFDHNSSESYGRQILFKSAKFKIMLMSWAPGDYTAIHNHGKTQWGAVQFFGEASHRLFSLQEGMLTLKKKETFNQGHVAPVCGNLTHMMGNSTNKNFTTLHIYGSNDQKEDFSKNAQIYAPEQFKKYRTMGSAYINMKKELILSEELFNNYCLDTVSDYFNLIEPFYHRNKQKEKLKAIKQYQKHPELFYQD